MQRLRLMAGEDEMEELPTGQRLRLNVLELMDFRGWTQAQLAKRLKKGQPWLSKRLSGKPWVDGGSRFQIEDLDALAHAFGLSPAELLQPGHGKWDRRRAGERRCGTDRRRNSGVPRDITTDERRTNAD